MEAVIRETDTAFVIVLKADTLKNASRLVRFKVNVVRELPIVSMNACRGGNVDATLVFQKKENVTSEI